MALHPAMAAAAVAAAAARRVPLLSSAGRARPAAGGAAGAAPPGAPFFCELCLERHDDGSATASHAFACGHRFCREGLARYLDLAIREAQVDALLCPHVGEGAGGSAGSRCPIRAEEADVEALCGKEAVARLRRFRAARGHAAYRECPRCCHPDVSGSPQRPQLVCAGCNHSFCFLHDDRHPGRTCREFERSVFSAFDADVGFVERCSRPCPRCGARVSKTGGCNHMTCRCGASFCWLCLRELGDPDDHYAPWNIFGCPGLHMQVSIGQRGRVLCSRYFIHVYQVVCASTVGMGSLAGCFVFALFFPLMVAMALVVFAGALGLAALLLLGAGAWTALGLVAWAASCVVALALPSCASRDGGGGDGSAAGPRQVPCARLRDCALYPWRATLERVRELRGGS